jgi:hypothetical protein
MVVQMEYRSVPQKIVVNPSVESVSGTEQSASYRQTVAIVVHLAGLHILLMSASIPIFICVPNGCTYPQGSVRSVSDGFKANSASSTAIWGSGIAWVTANRYLAAAASPFLYSSIAHVCIPIATYSAFLTLRYDTLEEFHDIFATLWIVSSFVLHFCITLRDIGDKGRTIGVFWVGVVLALILLTLFVFVQPSNSGGDVQLRSVISILKILTVYSLMFLDFVLGTLVLNTYMDGVGLFALMSGIESGIYRYMTRGVFWTFYMFLLLFGILYVARIL